MATPKVRITVTETVVTTYEVDQDSLIDLEFPLTQAEYEASELEVDDFFNGLEEAYESTNVDVEERSITIA